MQAIRRYASRDRHRYQKHDYDLDLTYILPNIVAMAFPGDTNYHKIYTNDIEDVAEFLDEMHGSHYHVYNLCLERSYPSRYFHHRVTRYRVADLNPPPIEMIREFCEDVDKWLSRDQRNVAVVHCHAGKGRTGMMISAFLLYKRMFSSGDRAIEFFQNQRIMPGFKAMHPGQERYVRYFARLVRERFVYSLRPLMLVAVELSECPALNGRLCSPCFTVKQRGVRSVYKSPVYRTTSRRRLLMELRKPLPVSGDVNIRFYDKQGLVKILLFWTWLNTYFVSSSSSSPCAQYPVVTAGHPADHWLPVPGRHGARHDGSRPGHRCFVSIHRVGGDDDDTTGFGGGDDGWGTGRLLTVALPQPDLDRVVQSTINDVLKPTFMVKLHFTTLPDGS